MSLDILYKKEYRTNECDETGGKMIVVDVYYNIGGFSYFTGETSPRGYYTSVSVQEIHSKNGFTSRSFSLLNSIGYKKLLFEVKRKSKKSDEKALNDAKEFIEGMIEKVTQESGLTIIREDD